jgi:hypothetical protein
MPLVSAGSLIALVLVISSLPPYFCLCSCIFYPEDGSNTFLQNSGAYISTTLQGNISHRMTILKYLIINNE